MPQSSSASIGRGRSRRTSSIASTLVAALALAVLSPTALAAAAVEDPRPIVISDFDAASQWTTLVRSGASGTLTIDSTEAHTGSTSGRLDVAIPSGTVEIVGGAVTIEATSLEFSVKSAAIDGVALRLTDSTGQAHQQRLPLNPAAAGWQTIRVEDFDSGPNYVSWGGAADGIWHGPLRRVSFVLDSGNMAPGLTAGTAFFDTLQVFKQAPPLAIVPTAVGNGFDAGQPVTIGFVSSAQSIAWTVRDANGTEVELGDATVAELGGSIPLGVNTPGWYEVDLVATAADGTTHAAGTDFSVLEPYDFSDSTDGRLSVATHYGMSWPLDSAPLLARAGFSSARDEAYWAGQETTAGAFSWQPKVNAYQAKLEELSVDQFHILSYGNPLYFEDEAPSTPEGREAFARYALASVEKFGTDDTIYEVWNEWNWRDRDGAAGASAAHYVALLEVVVPAVKAEYPDAVLVGPALAPMEDWEGWFREFATLGGLELVDAVSTHPYTFPQNPEGSARFEGHVDTLRGIMAEHGVDKPMYLSEVGWPTSTNSTGVTELTQAKHLVRAQLLAFADDIERFTIYDFMDDGLDPAENEHRFGIVRNANDPRGAFTPKPAYVSNAVLARQIDELPFDRTVDLGTDVHDVVFAGDGREVHAVWSTAPDGGALAFTTGGPVTVTDFYGAKTTLTPNANGAVTVSVGGEPVYVTGESITDVEVTTAFALQVDGEIVGDDASGTVVADNTSGTAPLHFTVNAGGADTTGTAAAGAAGEAAVTYPAQNSAGDRRYTATVSVDGDRVAWLSTTGVAASPLTLTGTHAVAEDGTEQLILRVANSSSRAVTVDAVAWTIGESTGTGLESAEIAAEQTVDLVVPVAVTAAVAWSATLTRGDTPPIAGSGTLKPIGASTEVVHHTVTVDGMVDLALAEANGIDLTADGAPAVTGWEGEQDLSGTLWLTHDADNLYVTASMVDDAHANPGTGSDIWRGDGIQVGITAGAPGETPRVQEIGFALGGAGEVDTYRWAPTDQSTEPTGMQASVVRDEDAKTTVYEASIPWTTLGIDPAARLLSTTVVVNENDGSGRAGWLTWGAGLAESKNPALYRSLLLSAVVPQEPVDTLDLRLTARSQCWPSGATVAVHAVNQGDLNTDIRVQSTFGQKKWSGVKPGDAVYVGFESGQPSIVAGTVTVAAYQWRRGDPAYERVELPYEAVSCE
ncbi:hypothetical protein J7E29_13420 [Streptomyces sp. ISL-90]|nr:hypothetical protein [Streptomyces sp. ISL-90]